MARRCRLPFQARNVPDRKDPMRRTLALVALTASLLCPTAAHAAEFRTEYDRVVSAFHAEVRAKDHLTRADVVRLVQIACYQRGIPGEEWAWLEDAIPAITKRESGWRTDAANPTSSALGIAQFLDAWGADRYRRDAVWSIDRMVRVYQDGGKAKIRQHWAATCTD